MHQQVEVAEFQNPVLFVAVDRDGRVDRRGFGINPQQCRDILAAVLKQVDEDLDDEMALWKRNETRLKANLASRAAQQTADPFEHPTGAECSDPATPDDAPVNEVLRQVIDQAIEIRKTKGLSQLDVAAQMDTTQSHVSEIESGRTADPQWSTIVRYVQACGAVMVVAAMDADQANNWINTWVIRDDASSQSSTSEADRNQ